MARTVTAERLIAASPQRVFDLLADPSMHPVLDGSGTVKRSLDGNPERLRLGAKFGMGMRLGVPYRIRNTVVEFEEGRRIAWRHFGGHRWRYELEPADGGTRVKETFDYTKGISRLYIGLTGFAERNRRGMEATLERLAAQAEG